jgi:[ribosomal protein S18]-alanine N-acetyltransferase
MAAHAIALQLATPKDARPIAVLSRDVIETGLGWSYPPSRVARLIADRETIVLVARDDASLVGFGAMSFRDERAHLVLLAVQAARQRRGIGRRLLDWLLASAAVAGVEAVELELRAANDAARDFYRKVGFVEAGLIEGYYCGIESALKMVRVYRPAA